MPPPPHKIFRPLLLIKNDTSLILSCTHNTWKYVHREPKRSRALCRYYPNSCAARQILLQGDISLNDGPTNKTQQRRAKARKPAAQCCTQCEKPVAKNHKRCICMICCDLSHVKCSNTFNPKQVSSSVLIEWVCPKCVISVLPFYKYNLASVDMYTRRSSIR